MATQNSTETTTISCLCRNIVEPASLLKHTQHPIPLELCHCDTCRHSSGALAGAFVDLVAPPSEECLSKCIEYASSSQVSRYFCSVCGSHVFVKGYGADGSVAGFSWAACVERKPAEGKENDAWDVDALKLESQMWISDTKDGGLAGRMVEVAKAKGVDGASKDLFNTVFWNMFDGPKLSFEQLDELITTSTAENKDPSSDKLLGKCHCGNVQFHVTRPDPTKEYSEQVKKRILRGSGTDLRWLAKLCLCRSCCISTGNPLHAWTYIPPEHITLPDGSPIGFVSEGKGKEFALKGVKQYKSSDIVTWTFCEKCGATIFYERGDRENGWCINVSIGVLRSETGALAKDYLEWSWERPSFEEETQVNEMIQSLQMDN